MNVKLDLYKTFCCVAKYKNFSKAADELYISQSAVTQAIQKLESQFNEKLFYRNKTGVELTDLGNKLFQHINSSLEILDNADTIFSNYSSLEAGELRISGSNTLISEILLNPLLKFVEKYPSVKVTISSSYSETMIEDVSNGNSDLAIINTPYSGKSFSNVEFTSLRQSSYCLFASKKYIEEHPFTSLNDLKKHKLILPHKSTNRYRIFLKLYRDYISNVEPNFQVPSSSIVKKIVLSDCGIGFAESESLKDIQDDIVILDNVALKEDTQSIATLSKHAQSKATKEFLKILFDAYKE